jgi:hypothetical protein
VIPTNTRHGLQCLVQISTPTHLTLTALDMSDPTGHATRVPPPICRQPGPVGSSNERRTRRHARDFSHTGITCTGNVPSPSRSTPPGPDVEKELPATPSTSTGLWDTEPATSTPSLPPLPVVQKLGRTQITEAQKIAARYRRHYGSLNALRSGVSCPPNLEVSSFLVSRLPLSFSPRISWITSAPRRSY